MKKINIKIFLLIIIMSFLIIGCEASIDPDVVDTEAAIQSINNEFTLTLISQIGAILGLIFGFVLLLLGITGKTTLELNFYRFECTINTYLAGIIIMILSLIVLWRKKQKVIIQREHSKEIKKKH